MTGKVLEIEHLVEPDELAEAVSHKYQDWVRRRSGKESEWREVRNYLYATDTTTTTNSHLPWKNKTTVPKLTQIFDNLKANYMSSLFPNDNWLDWEGHSEDAVHKDKRKKILAYMRNKLDLGGFEQTIGTLIDDYIIYGNPIGDVEYVHEKHLDPTTEEEIDGFVGPRAVRVSPLDIVFNPTAPSFEESPKITRTVMSFGELMMLADTRPDLNYSQEALEHAKDVRHRITTRSEADDIKTDGYQMDGFDDITQYYESGHVEILEFEGNISMHTGELKQNRIITIIDRAKVIRDEPNPAWNGKDGKVHTAWRTRPDNLYGMGPLDNLVGMQYRLDHLENIKADLFDLIAHPPLKIRGEVEAFDFEPFVKIFVGDDGDVEILKIDAVALNADQQIAILEQRMEEMAGAPREAMGIRSPGEKTAFEVQQLDNAASRIFQEKIRQFETHVLEPLLNNMLEIARRMMNVKDTIRVMDDDLGVVEFMDITKEEISSSGRLRAKGASHFAAKNLLMQNLLNLGNNQLFASIQPHMSSLRLAQAIESAMGLERLDLFEENIAIREQAEAEREANSQTDQLELEQTIAAEDPFDEDEALQLDQI